MPSGPVNISTTLPRGHMPRGVKCSRLHMRSCFSMVSYFCFHLVRLIGVRAYSLNSRFQKLSGRSLVSLQGLLLSLLVFVCS